MGLLLGSRTAHACKIEVCYTAVVTNYDVMVLGCGWECCFTFFCFFYTFWGLVTIFDNVNLYWVQKLSFISSLMWPSHQIYVALYWKNHNCTVLTCDYANKTISIIFFIVIHDATSPPASNHLVIDETEHKPNIKMHTSITNKNAIYQSKINP